MGATGNTPTGAQSHANAHIRELDFNSPAEIELIANRMRLTLIERLGEPRGTSM